MTDGHDSDFLADFSDEKLELLDQMLADEGIGARDATGIVAGPRPAVLPLSYAQELLWLLDRASPGMTAYNSGLARRVRGPLDVAALQRALDALVARHEILRTTYGFEGDQPVQHIANPRAVSLSVVDVSNRPGATRESEAIAAAREALRTPFDLTKDLLLRATLVRIADDDHVLALASHHIVLDGWSRSIMFRELGVYYEAFRRGETPALSTLPIQYADFALWQREQLSGPALQLLLDYWRGVLGDAPHELELPTDFPRPAHPSFEGAQQSLALSPELAAGVRALAQKHDATLYMVLLTAYQTVLHRWTGQDTIVSGSPIVGRGMTEMEHVIGYFANTLVLRGEFADDPTFSGLLTRMRETALGAYEHQEIPLEKLVFELREGQERLNPTPLVQVVLTMHDMATGDLRLGDLALSGLGFESESSKFDLTLLAADREDGIRFTLHYRTDLFRKETAARFLTHLHAVLVQAVAAPETHVSQIALVSRDERVALDAWNATTVDEGTPATLVQLFEGQAARVPGRAAVVSPRASATAAGSVAGTLALTYAELNARANQLAQHLRTLGITRNAPVGLLLDRSGDALVGLVGILKAGGAYMPLAVDAPPARLAQQVTESGAKVVVTSGALADRLPTSSIIVALDRDASMLGALPDANVPAAGTPDDLAYVLFTSGSTGVPKGVAVTHGNAVHYARAVSRVLADVAPAQSGDGLSALDGLSFGMVSTLAADLGNTSLLVSLLSGGTLHLLGKEVTTDPARYAEYASAHAFDILKITPNHLAALTAGKSGADLASVLPRRWVVVGGEALRPDVARTLLSAGTCRLLNHYGPTETTVGVLTGEATSASLDEVAALGAQTVPLGRPLSNTHTYVVDAHGSEQPIGMPGELWVGGAGVSQGYLNRPELTAERFASFNGERVYKSGDRVRRLSNGAIEFLGRADHQVKVRGFRVELGEIEQVLRSHPGVAQGIVVLREDADMEPRLIAYAVAKAAGYAVSHSDRPTVEKLTDWFASQLPDYMVPAAVLLLESLPLTSNGKIDMRALPAPEGSAAAQDSYVAPTTETETKLATIWAEVLKRERVGLTDNFLALGGHSLLAIRVLGKISRTFGVRLPLRTLFDAPTIAQLGAIVDAQAGPGAAPAAPTIGARSRDAHRIQLPTDGPDRGPAGVGGDVR
ncbi:MAG: amino acid adenylation domain-containing protein [bacterium]